MKKAISFLTLVFIATTTYVNVNAQQATAIEGIVIDEHNKPLADVNLRIGPRLGTMSNAEGAFILKFSEDISKDSLLVSSIGYKAVKIPLSGNPTNLRIQLFLDIVQLNEIEIFSLNAESIIKRAIKNIPLNYSHKPFEMVSFYREMGKIDADYLSFAEASMNILNQGYQESNKKDLVVINKERNLKKIGEKEVNNPFHTALNGLPYIIMENDLIKHPGAIFGASYIGKYDYEVTGSVKVDGEEAYVISFDQKDGIKTALYKGTVVVIKSSYAIASIDFTLSEKGRKYAESDIPFLQRPLLKIMGYSLEKQDEQLTERYLKINNKWYPYFYRIATIHHVKSRKHHIDGNLQVSAELFISSINENPVNKYDKKAIMPSSYSFQKNVKNDQDSYWEDYNFIKPGEELKAIAEKIKKN